VLVNGKLVAKAEVVVVDNKFGARITDVVSPEKRVENLKN
jgi:flagellar motor switch protein FliN/FliY